MTTVNERWKDDMEFDELPLSEVKREDNGDLMLSREGDWGSLWIANPGFDVKVGQMCRFYGKGTGFPVRGVVIDGRVARYQSIDEHEAQMRAQSEAFHRDVEAGEKAAKDAGRDELVMRDTAVPRHDTIEALSAYIKELSEGPHTYGTCVYAMSMAAVAAFNFISSQLGVTGFQASCADMDVLRRTRGIDGPFMLIKAEDALYPQYDLRERLNESLQKWQPWLAETAIKKLAEHDMAHPNVIAHWRRLATEPVNR